MIFGQFPARAALQEHYLGLTESNIPGNKLDKFPQQVQGKPVMVFGLKLGLVE